MKNADFLNFYLNFLKESSFYPKYSIRIEKIYLLWGLMGEIGELINVFKKEIRESKLRTVEVVYELGDVFWYLLSFSNVYIGEDYSLRLLEITEKNNSRKEEYLMTLEQVGRLFSVTYEIVQASCYLSQSTGRIEKKRGLRNIAKGLGEILGERGLELEDVLRKNYEKLEKRRKEKLMST